MFFRSKVGRNVTGVAVMLRELVGVLRDDKWTSLAGGYNRCVDKRILKQLVHRAAHTLAVDRIAVEIAEDHEARIGSKSSLLACVIDQVSAFRGVDVVGK